MIDRQEMEKYLDVALIAAVADQTEVLVYKEAAALTRFSNSEIHQNMAEKNTAVSIRSIFGKKIGTSSTNKLDTASIKLAVAEAEKNARLSPEDVSFTSLPLSDPIFSDAGYIESTAVASPGRRAEIVRQVIAVAADGGLEAAGSVSTNETAIAVANSLGSRAIGSVSDIYLNIVAIGDDTSGFAEFYGRDIDKLDAAAIARTAVDKALAGISPGTTDPGQYTVILEPAAVADMIGFLAYAGLGALSVQEKRSFMCDNFGKRLISDKVTIWDDAADMRSVGLPFDFEGVPKGKVTFFDKGVATGVAYDSYTAAREGKKSTGHALPAPNTFGPIPTNMFMAGGDSSTAEMIASTEKGLLVTRFHYTNFEDPLKTIFTGMTRDGTFLIENGKIVRAVRNLRFTQSILEALSNVEAISRDGQLTQSFVGACFAPTIKITKFNFTGVTE